MAYWDPFPELSREELLRITKSREFYDILEDLVRRELAREGRRTLSLEGELARVVAVAVRTCVELLLPLTDDNAHSAGRLPYDIMSAPPPFSDFPEDPEEMN